MSGNLISLAAEGLVAVLLIITIGYCVVLNSRLKRLRADESDLRATISELVTATEIAERAIGGLKAAAVDCDRTLSTRMREAEHFSIEIAREIAEGQKVLSRIKQIATAVRRSEPTQQVTSVSQDVGPIAETPAESPKGKADARSLQQHIEIAVTAASAGAGKSAVKEPVVQLPADAVRQSSGSQIRATGRIDELRVMAEQARERLKELRKVNTEKAA